MRQLKIQPSITRREDRSVEKYLQEVGKIDLLTPEEEVELTKKIREGDQGALEKLVSANLRFVVSVAKQYQHPSLSLNDLINEGNLGLIKAAQKFDETRGFKFISYAVWRVRQSILQALVEKSRMIRQPGNMSNMIKRLNTESSTFEQQYEREPTTEELAEILEMSPSIIESIQQSKTNHISLDQPIGHEDGSLLIDVVGDPSADIANTLLVESDYAHEKLNIYFSKMDKRQVKILKMYFGIGYTNSYSLDDIGNEMKLTRERSRQIKDSGIMKLRSMINKDPDRNFLLGVLQK